MVDLTDLRLLIQEEETQFRYGISESWAQKLGGSMNFMMNRLHQEKQFFANGPYNIMTMPQTGVDGLTIMEFDALIINAWAFNLVAGSGSTTELDIKLATAPGGAFSSIFSTTPKFTSSAGSNAWIGVGETLSGATAPVLSTTQVSTGDALRFDIITAMTGSPQNCGIVIHYRPR